jgi:hypothetical protein
MSALKSRHARPRVALQGGKPNGGAAVLCGFWQRVRPLPFPLVRFDFFLRSDRLPYPAGNAPLNIYLDKL